MHDDDMPCQQQRHTTMMHNDDMPRQGPHTTTCYVNNDTRRRQRATLTTRHNDDNVPHQRRGTLTTGTDDEWGRWLWLQMAQGLEARLSRAFSKFIFITMFLTILMNNYSIGTTLVLPMETQGRQERETTAGRVNRGSRRDTTCLEPQVWFFYII